MTAHGEEEAEMSGIVVVGGGVCGLVTAMLLARDGHEVRVLEADAHGPPGDLDAAWESWDRSGVAQFRQPHNLNARCRHLLAAELPDVLEALAAAGAHRMDPLDSLPPLITDRAPRPRDDIFWTLTGRRPMVESVFAASAEREPGVEVLRGVRVRGVRTGPPAMEGVPHVVGIDTDELGALDADLVVDAMGRRSNVGEWIAAAGGRPPQERSEDCRFVYYTRFFSSPDGGLPEVRAPLLSHFPTFSLLTLPADNGNWSVTVFTPTTDPSLKRLRFEEVFTRVVAACPLQAHWLDGVPRGGIAPMSGIADRIRRFVVDDAPLVTGMVSVADAWACTNPSAGRGIAVGMLHAAKLRDAVRAHADAPVELALAFDDAAEREVAPWFHLQVAMDRARLGAVEAVLQGREPPPPTTDLGRQIAAMVKATPYDADAYRTFLEMFACLALPQELAARPGVLDHVMAVAEGVEPLTLPGPGRDELFALVA